MLLYIWRSRCGLVGLESIPQPDGYRLGRRSKQRAQSLGVPSCGFAMRCKQ